MTTSCQVASSLRSPIAQADGPFGRDLRLAEQGEQWQSASKVSEGDTQSSSPAPGKDS